MDDSLRNVEPLALVRPRGAHRFDVFSLKLKRRLTLYRRCALDAALMFEADPEVVAFCERPGFVRLGDRRYLADFWVRYAEREELSVLFPAFSLNDEKQRSPEFDVEAMSVRIIEPPELAASRIWIENWQRMLPCLVATRGLVPASLLDAIERFVATPQPLLAIEREFSTGDPVLARAAVFSLLHGGRVQASELRTGALSLLTRFVAVGAAS